MPCISFLGHFVWRAISISWGFFACEVFAEIGRDESEMARFPLTGSFPSPTRTRVWSFPTGSVTHAIHHSARNLSSLDQD
jgi:hypothetical protein